MLMSRAACRYGALLVVLALLQAVTEAAIAGLKWETISRNESLPLESILGGYQRVDKYDNPHYLGRVSYKEALVPATVTRYQPYFTAYTGWRDVGVTDVDAFEIAVADGKKVRWERAQDGDVPAGASAAGYAPDGEVLYACRVFNSDRRVGNHVYMMTIGVLQPSAGQCVTEFHGVHKDAAYQVLVVDA